MIDDLDALVGRFIAVQQAEGFRPNPGADPVVILDWEQSHGLKLPDDFRRYLLASDGCSDGFMPGNASGIWNFYPVAEWTSGKSRQGLNHLTYEKIPEAWRAHGCLWFADALLMAPFYGICLNPDSSLWGWVVMWDDEYPEDYEGRPADLHSFSTFMREIVRDPSDPTFMFW